ncbi:asparagine synthase (glutamine-hydrolyzing) [Usitatibacter rugosus]|uniref:asparagine synthase (glutamine-hydrolyzing) n=1 Tax=Usitatibacter rugosus TaxID=2732067 RepID=UPI001FE38AA7
MDRAELQRIGDAMAARGPDGSGLWISPDNRVGLAHRRLAIIDLSAAGAQPMSTEDGQLRITYNGEIYNYRALRSDLESKGYRFRSESDTEVLLHLYADRGPDMVHALRGMFAFAIWDERRHGMFLARDPFGIKPLYVADDGSTLRFASQVKALLAGGGVPRREDPAGSVGFLLWGFVPEPFSLYRDIRSIAAGSHLWIGKDGLAAETQYFSTREEMLRIEGEERRPAGGDAMAELRAALDESIDHHLVADVPVGLFLSSGIDSCVVASFAGARLGDRLHSLTLGFSEFKNTEYDETVLAARVAADLGIKHSTCWTSREQVDAGLSSYFEAMDQPSMDGLNTWLVSKAAKDSGIKVALSGLGGDELFAGYPSFTQVPATARWASPFAKHAGISRAVRRAAEPLLAPFTSPKYAGLLEYGGSVSGAYLLRRALYMPWEVARVLDPAFVEEGLKRLDTEDRLRVALGNISHERLAVSALELDWYLRSQLLRDSDWAGMAHSVEIRVPFVDVPLFRMVARQVADERAPTKKDLLRAVSGELPALLSTRPKTGFNVPVREWFGTSLPGERAERGLRTWARRVLDKWNLPAKPQGRPGKPPKMAGAPNVPS